MKKSLRLSALGLSTALAISGLAVVQPTIAGFQPAATASADETTSGMPRNIFKDSDNVDYRYDSAYNTFDKLYKARSFYAAAFRKITGYDYYQTRNKYTVFAEMEDGARGIVILQALDYKIEASETEEALAARDIDLTQIGTDEATRTNALRILNHALEKYAETKDSDEVIKARYDFINQSKTGMHNYVNNNVYRAPASAVLNLGLKDSELEGISAENEYGETFTLADTEGVTVLKIEDHAFPGTDQAETINANGETNATALEEKFGPIVPAAVDPETAYTEVNAILVAVEDLVQVYEHEENNGADLMELRELREGAAKIGREIKELRDSGNGQGILDKKPEAEKLKERADAVAAAVQAAMKKNLKESTTASQTAAQELKDEAKKAELTKQATDLLAKIEAAEGYDNISALADEVSALKKAVEDAKKAEVPAENPAGDVNSNDNTKPGKDDTKPGKDDTKPGKDDTKPGKDGSSDKLDGGAIAGIVIGVLALLGAILGGIFHFFPQLKAMLHLPTRF